MDSQPLDEVPLLSEASEYEDVSLDGYVVFIDTAERRIGQKSYIAYCIEVILRKSNTEFVSLKAGNLWNVERRYSDFSNLDKSLKSFFPDFLEDLPEKKSFSSVTDAKIITQRKKILDTYLQSLLKNKLMHRDWRCRRLLHRFLANTDVFNPVLNLDRDAKIGKKNFKNHARAAHPLNTAAMASFLRLFSVTSKAHHQAPTTPLVSTTIGKKDDLKDRTEIKGGVSASGFASRVNDALQVVEPLVKLPWRPVEHASRILSLFLTNSWWWGPAHAVSLVGCMLGGSYFDAMFANIVYAKVAKVTSSDSVCQLIGMLTESMVSSSKARSPKYATGDMKKLLVTLVQQHVASNIIDNTIGLAELNAIMDTVTLLPQLTLLNKQLAYTVLDALVGSLFPELRPNPQP